MGAAPDVTIRPVTDFTSLAFEWQALEARADSSFFQSWAWTGCLVEERFSDPWLLRASCGGVTSALALFNRRPARRFGLGRTLHLGESGSPQADSIFIEHNGLLIARDAPPGLAALCWRALAATRGAGIGRARWVLSGVPRGTEADLPVSSSVRITAGRPAPFVDLRQIAAGGDPLTSGLSANTRQQLRRSLRAWAAIGPIELERAADPDRAGDFLDRLRVLHQAYWAGRGRPGAFAPPFFMRFHRALLSRAGEGQSVDLIEVRAGARVVGYLYNLVHHGWVAAYQSGFAYGDDSGQLRPGMVCHALAIAHYRAAGMRIYDFLGGEARYKRSFADRETELLWLKVRHRTLWPFGRRAAIAAQPGL